MQRTVTLTAIVLFAGCAGEPTLQEGPDAELTFDGLARIDNAAFQDAWADPAADWARYDTIVPGGAEFEFRAVKKTSTHRALSSSSEYWIDDAARARLIEEVSAVFAEELAKSERFSTADSPGPNTLIIGGGLTDIVSRVPPEYVGRSEVFLSTVGEATLVLEISDSLSGEVLFRAVDRRAAERAGGTQATRSTSATNWAEVRRLARRWGTKLREGLDALPTE